MIEEQQDVLYMKSQEFLIAITQKNYELALQLAREYLALDPTNQLFLEYETVLIQKIAAIGSESSSSNDQETSESSSETDDTESGSKI